jgi:hypothetical protein
MELKLNVHYKPTISAFPKKYVGRDLTGQQMLKVKDMFWKENRDKFRCFLPSSLNVWDWVMMLEQVVDENIIDMSTLEIVEFNHHFNNNTYEVDFDITFKFEVIDESGLFIQKNKFRKLIDDWIYQNKFFVGLGDNGSWKVDENTSVRYGAIVTDENLEMSIELRK